MEIKQNGLAKTCHHHRAPLDSPHCAVERALLAARGQAEPHHPFCALHCNFSCRTNAYEERRTPATGSQGPAASGLGRSARLWVLAWNGLPCAWNGHLLQGLSALLWRQCQGHQLQHVANPTSQAPSWGLQVGVTLLLVFKGHSFFYTLALTVQSDILLAHKTPVKPNSSQNVPLTYIKIWNEASTTQVPAASYH